METKKYNFVVDEQNAERRLDHCLGGLLPEHSRSFIQKLLADRQITVNQRPSKSSYRVQPGDKITVLLPPPAPTDILAEKIDLDILYEDADLLVINKAAGMVVHPGAGIHRGTMVNALMYHCKDLSGIGGRLRPGIVHRLDKDTSGALVVAKNDRSHIALQQQFAEKSATRLYKTLVWGVPASRKGRIEGYLNRSKKDRTRFSVSEQGKMAISDFTVVETFAFTALLDVQLQTGRTHQIRVHMNHMHHPVFGDPQYNGRQSQLNRLSSLSDRHLALYLLKQFQRQALHAMYLTFTHPADLKRRTFEAALPPDFDSLLKQIRKNEVTE